MESKTKFIGVREAAKLLGVSHNTLRKMIAEGEIVMVGEVGPQRAIALDPDYIRAEAVARKERQVVATTG